MYMYKASLHLHNYKSKSWQFHSKTLHFRYGMVWYDGKDMIWYDMI